MTTLALEKEVRRLVNRRPAEDEMLRCLDGQLSQQIVLKSDTTDEGNSPTSLLRAKLPIGLFDGLTTYGSYDPDANDGRQNVHGVLVEALAQGGTGLMAIAGLLASAPPTIDVRGRTELSLGGMRIAGDAPIAPFLCPRRKSRKSSNYTVTAAENGTLFLATAAVVFTLPAKENGLQFRFFQTADADLTVSGAGSDMIARGSATASSVGWVTSGQKIGSQVLVECIYTATDTLKWLVTNLGATTISVA